LAEVFSGALAGVDADAAAGATTGSVTFAAGFGAAFGALRGTSVFGDFTAGEALAAGAFFTCSLILLSNKQYGQFIQNETTIRLSFHDHFELRVRG
jgi:uncharacterized transporter YbjL